MKIEVGDVVELNNGEVHKVDRMLGGDPDYVDVAPELGPFVIDGMNYHKDGRFADCGYSHNLSVKRIISRASDDAQSSQEGEPKLWRDMTNEEKGALLLAKHEGGVIQSSRNGTGWALDGRVGYCNDVYFRVKPEPVRETVTLMIDDGSMGGPRAIGTIDLNDGEPDRSSIKIGED